MFFIRFKALISSKHPKLAVFFKKIKFRFLSKKVIFSLNEGNLFVVCLQGDDLRKGLDGLSGMIRYLSLNPTNGDVYVFLNKSRTTMKLLH